MHILLLNQFFWPDSAATGQLLSDLAQHLSETGSTVEVVCGPADYAAESASASAPDVTVHRFRTARFSRKHSGRLRSYLSFLFQAIWRTLWLTRPDVVVTMTTPPLLSLVGLFLQKVKGARHVIWEMDVYPDIAVDLGVLSGSGISTSILRWLSDLPRRHADCIIVLGECMRARLVAHGVPGEKIVVAENWAEDGSVFPEKSAAPKPYDADALSILYSGNFGMAHDVETLAAAVLQLDSASSDTHFTVAGGGTRHSWLKDFCAEHKVGNLTFRGYGERKELAARLMSCHIGLVTQKAESLGSVVPSKTYGILAAGRPVLYIGPRESTAARVIEKYGCGWAVECGEVDKLVELLRFLGNRRDLVDEAGSRAYRAYMDHYHRSKGVTRVSGFIRARSAVTASARPRPVAD